MWWGDGDLEWSRSVHAGNLPTVVLEAVCCAIGNPMQGYIVVGAGGYLLRNCEDGNGGSFQPAIPTFCINQPRVMIVVGSFQEGIRNRVINMIVG